MSSWGKAIGLGVLMWLLSFVIAVFVFPLRQLSRPLFESIMAVAVTGGAVLLGLLYFRGVEDRRLQEGFLLGVLWFALSVLIDAPLMLLGGPMQMTFGAYMADIGVTYLCIPVVTCGLAGARAQRGGRTAS
jgi:hypothetical protein